MKIEGSPQELEHSWLYLLIVFWIISSLDIINHLL